MKKIVFRMFRVAMLVMAVAGVMSSCGGASADKSSEEKASEVKTDMSTFQLKGEVKSVTYKEDYYFGSRTFNFTEDGKLQCDSSVVVERDSVDRIKMLLFPYKSETGVDLKYVVSFRYDKDGRVSAIRDEDQGWSSRAKLTYDEKGFVSVDSTKSPEGLSVTDYKYSKVDDKGNWVAREYVTRNSAKTDSLAEEKGSEERAIIYYEDI